MPEELNKSRFSVGLTTIILAIIMLILPLVFFFLLSQKTEASFGFIQILFSIVFAIIVTLFLLWLKSFMKNRPYLGFIIGLIALGFSNYGLFFRYKGPYTKTFAIIGSLIVLVYLGFYLFKYRKQNILVKGKDELDEEL